MKYYRINRIFKKRKGSQQNSERVTKALSQHCIMLEYNVNVDLRHVDLKINLTKPQVWKLFGFENYDVLVLLS